MRFLVVGCGSMGERHIRNLKSLKAGEIVACDTNKNRLCAMKKYNVKLYDDFEQALAQNVDAVIVCTPPNSHIPIALESINQGANVFIEKPISNTMTDVDKLIKNAAKKKLLTYVGYNLRFHSGLNIVKKMIDDNKIGRILSAHIEVGQYLPDWHPWQDYREGYTAQKKLGGGIILDASHEIDYACWLMGEVKEVFCFANKISNLKVETEDIAEILLKFKSNVVALVHLDFIQRAYSRSCKLIGEEGTIIWDFMDKSVKVYSTENKKWEVYGIKEEPNDMYLKEIKHFIRCLSEKEEPLVDAKVGKNVLNVALAAKQSAETHKVVRL